MTMLTKKEREDLLLVYKLGKMVGGDETAKTAIFNSIAELYINNKITTEDIANIITDCYNYDKE